MAPPAVCKRNGRAEAVCCRDGTAPDVPREEIGGQGDGNSGHPATSTPSEPAVLRTGCPPRSRERGGVGETQGTGEGSAPRGVRGLCLLPSLRTSVCCRRRRQTGQRRAGVCKMPLQPAGGRASRAADRAARVTPPHLNSRPPPLHAAVVRFVDAVFFASRRRAGQAEDTRRRAGQGEAGLGMPPGAGGWARRPVPQSCAGHARARPVHMALPRLPPHPLLPAVAG